MKLDESWTEGGVSGFRKSDFPNPRNHKAPRCGALRYGAAPDERYVSEGLGFSGDWSSVENSAYPN